MNTYKLTARTAIIIDGEVETTLREFFSDNLDSLSLEEQQAILECLRHGAQYMGGGGAGATFTVELAN